MGEDWRVRSGISVRGGGSVGRDKMREEDEAYYFVISAWPILSSDEHSH